MYIDYQIRNEAIVVLHCCILESTNSCFHVSGAYKLSFRFDYSECYSCYFVEKIKNSKPYLAK